MAWAGEALGVGRRRGEVVELRACIGRRGHQCAPLRAGGKASHEAGAGAGRHGELLAEVGPGQRT